MFWSSAEGLAVEATPRRVSINLLIRLASRLPLPSGRMARFFRLAQKNTLS